MNDATRPIRAALLAAEVHAEAERRFAAPDRRRPLETKPHVRCQEPGCAGAFGTLAVLEDHYAAVHPEIVTARKAALRKVGALALALLVVAVVGLWVVIATAPAPAAQEARRQ